jgi:hypothetical protein
VRAVKKTFVKKTTAGSAYWDLLLAQQVHNLLTWVWDPPTQVGPTHVSSCAQIVHQAFPRLIYRQTFGTYSVFT